ncbi:hypothetical protein CSOJ01_05344 [Colletotrichum sojae]|uniref:Uncharacterized protein n=1 Tax=Colletotrichum sojae TaxID=2175907 RepID=A0A8H6JG78_9PEZI|nr:hypothetical protein CSOJ01_05344 [Colletotrichum sojae]
MLGIPPMSTDTTTLPTPGRSMIPRITPAREHLNTPDAIACHRAFRPLAVLSPPLCALWSLHLPCQAEQVSGWAGRIPLSSSFHDDNDRPVSSAFGG